MELVRLYHRQAQWSLMPVQSWRWLPALWKSSLNTSRDHNREGQASSISSPKRRLLNDLLQLDCTAKMEKARRGKPARSWVAGGLAPVVCNQLPMPLASRILNIYLLLVILLLCVY